MADVGEQDVSVTSCDIIRSCCRPQKKRCLSFEKLVFFVCVRLLFKVQTCFVTVVAK